MAQKVKKTKQKRNTSFNRTKRIVQRGGAPNTKYAETMIPAVVPPNISSPYEKICQDISETANKMGTKYFANSRLPSSLLYLSK
jgi:hypothetical protein